MYGKVVCFCVCMRWCVSGGVCIGVLLGHVVSGGVTCGSRYCVYVGCYVFCVCVRALYRGLVCVWVVVCECSACGGMGGCVVVVSWELLMISALPDGQGAERGL